MPLFFFFCPSSSAGPPGLQPSKLADWGSAGPESNTNGHGPASTLPRMTSHSNSNAEQGKRQTHMQHFHRNSHVILPVTLKMVIVDKLSKGLFVLLSCLFTIHTVWTWDETDYCLCMWFHDRWDGAEEGQEGASIFHVWANRGSSHLPPQKPEQWWPGQGCSGETKRTP